MRKTREIMKDIKATKKEADILYKYITENNKVDLYDRYKELADKINRLVTELNEAVA